MKLRFKMEYLKKIYYRYHKATKGKKKQILDEFCQNCSYHRKYAIRLLNDLPPEDRRNHKRKRKYQYLLQTISILEAIWEAAGYPWSNRLKSALPLWIPYARQQFQITPKIEQQLLSRGSGDQDMEISGIQSQVSTPKYWLPFLTPYPL